MELTIQAHEGKVAIAAKYTAALSVETARTLLEAMQRADGEKVRFESAERKAAGLSARCENDTVYLEFAANFGDHVDVSAIETPRNAAITKLTKVLSTFEQ